MPNETQNRSGEMELLIASARESFRRLHGWPLSSEADAWSLDTLLPLALKHRVAGLIHAAFPSADRTDWQAAAYGQAAYTGRCCALAEDLFDRLSAQTGLTLLIKGPALAKQAWPYMALRSFDDLDFCCAREAYPSICTAMEASGLEPIQPDDARRIHYWHYGWGISFRDSSGIIVEFNHRFFPPQWPWPRAMQPHRTAAIIDWKLDGASVKTLSPSFHLLICCVHALWHGGERLSWLGDIAGLLLRNPRAFAEAVELTSHPFLLRALHTSCRIADVLFGPELVPASSTRVNEEVVTLYIAQLQSGLHPGAKERQRLHDMLLTPVERARYHALRLLTPGDGDFRRWVLPPDFGSLYWLLRPLRLLSDRGLQQ